MPATRIQDCLDDVGRLPPWLAPALPMLLAVGEPQGLRPEARLWEVGDPPVAAYVLCRGLVALSDAPGDDARVTEIGTRGVAIGLDDLLASSPRATAAEVIVPSVVIRLVPAQVRGVLHAGGAGATLFGALVGGSSRRLASTRREVLDGPVERRLAALMLRLGEETGLPDARGLFIPHRLSRTRLATLVNCRLETLVRLLRGHPVFSRLQFLREGVVVPNVAELGRVLAVR